MSVTLYIDDLWPDPPANPSRPVVAAWDFTGGSDFAVLQTPDAEVSTVNFDRVGEVAGLMPFRIPYQGPVGFAELEDDPGSAIVVHAQFHYFNAFEGILSTFADLVDERTWDGLTSDELGTAILFTTRVDVAYDWGVGQGAGSPGPSAAALQDAYDTGNLVLVAHVNAPADASQVQFSYLTVEVVPTETTTALAVTRQFPRDDALGLGSGTRIYPPARSGRIVGGHL